MPRDVAMANLLEVSALAGRQATSLTLRAPIIAAIVWHLRSCLPREGVGLLAAAQSGALLQASRFLPGTNVATSATRFALHPREVERMLEDILARNELLGAIVHSHPSGPATPSPVDIAEATLDSVIHLIVQLEPTLRLRAWRYVRTQAGGTPVVQEVQVIANGSDSDKLTGDSLRICRSLDLCSLES